jgi:hypothetical protein
LAPIIGDRRFDKWLTKVTPRELEALGISLENVGSHTFRKGIAEFVALLICGPSAIAIYIFFVNTKNF